MGYYLSKVKDRNPNENKHLPYDGGGASLPLYCDSGNTNCLFSADALNCPMFPSGPSGHKFYDGLFTRSLFFPRIVHMH